MCGLIAPFIIEADFPNNACDPVEFELFAVL